MLWEVFLDMKDYTWLNKDNETIMAPESTRLLTLVNKIMTIDSGELEVEGRNFSESESPECVCWGRIPEWRGRWGVGRRKDEFSKETGGEQMALGVPAPPPGKGNCDEWERF